jgi:hypothetical protein
MMDEQRLGADDAMEPSTPIVRPYALTGGRTRGRTIDLPLEAQVVATEGATTRTSHLSTEQQRIIELAITPLSVAEVAALVKVPLGVVRVLVSDLSEDGLLQVGGGYAMSSTGYTPEERGEMGAPAGPNSNDILLLERVLHGLRDI